MTTKLITAKKGANSDEAIGLMHKHRIEKLPILDNDGSTLVGLFTIKDIEKSRRFPDASKDSAGRLLVGAAVGVGTDARERIQRLIEADVDVIVVDTAHAHSKSVLETIKSIRQDYKTDRIEIVGGNVATPEGTRALIEAGVDGVKVGMGPGSICTTRIIAGIGVPQFTAIVNCSAAARDLDRNVAIISDGGIQYSGDIAKALAAGADSVMIGNLFAGTEEAPGEMILYQGKSYKVYRGMGSLGAMQKGSGDRYFQGHIEEHGKFVPEGIEGRVAYRGPLASTIFQLQGGVRQAMGYLGVANIAELQKNAEFIVISSASHRESHVHDVFVSREAPNYKLD